MSFQKELKHFQDNKKTYTKKYINQFLLIKGDKLLGNFISEAEAYKKGLEIFGNEPFLIKQVLDNENSTSFSSLYFGLNNASL